MVPILSPADARITSEHLQVPNNVSRTTPRSRLTHTPSADSTSVGPTAPHANHSLPEFQAPPSSPANHSESASYASRHPHAQQSSSNQSTLTVRRIRPLPPIPNSAPPAIPATRDLPHSFHSRRPLPSAPVNQEPVIITITPVPRSASLPTHPLASAHQLSSRPALAPLSLQTSPDVLGTTSIDQQILTPVTPEIPTAPSPRTLRKKRMSKLRRHLGERVPDELVVGAEQGAAPAAPIKFVNVLESLRENIPNAAIAARKVLEIHVPESDTEDEDEDEDEKQDPVWGRPRHAPINSNRYSRKWIWERGGERWVETNHDDVLRMLRNL